MTSLRRIIHSKSLRGSATVLGSAAVCILLIAGSVAAVLHFFPESGYSTSDATTSATPSAPTPVTAATITTAAPTTAHTTGTTANASGKPYVAAVCSKTPIKFTTNYVNDSTRYVGETWTNSIPGQDGYIWSCGPDSSGFVLPPSTVPPVNKTVYVGTKVKAATPTPAPTKPSYAEAWARCSQLPQNTSAPASCMAAYGYVAPPY